LSSPSDIHLHENAGSLQLRGNLWLRESDRSPFVDHGQGDLHLKDGMVEELLAEEGVETEGRDIDGKLRGKRPVCGAHEVA